MIEMKVNSEIFFNHLIEFGSGRYNEFTRFAESSVEGAIEFRNIVPGVCPMFVINQNTVSAVLEARMPQRKSKSIIQELFNSHGDRISRSIGIEMLVNVPDDVSKFNRVSITHNIPTIRTDLSFKEFMAAICSSMNEMLVTVKSIEN